MFKRRSRSSVRAWTVLLAVGLLAGPVLGASAGATARAHVASTKFKCSAPPVVTMGLAGSPGADFIQDFPIYAFGAQLEAVCHTTLDVEYLTLSATAALLGGSIMYASGSTYNQIKAYDQGATNSEVQLFQQVQGGSTIYVAPIKYKSFGTGINAIVKFANLTWGVPFLVGANAIYYDKELKAAGINPQSVNFDIVGQDGSQALANGQIQLLQQLNTFALVPLLASGQYYEVWNSSGLQALNEVGFIPSGALDAMQSTISEYPSLTQEMVNIQIEALQMMRKDINKPAAIYATYPAAAKALIPYSTFLATWPTWRAAFVPLTGLLTTAELHRATNLGFDYGFTPADTQLPNSAINTKFLDNAYKQYGMKPPTTSIDPAYEYLMSTKTDVITP
jgi:ABC-type nitrate/sulfonate/bicarbonate transport system substrate-binding protein